MAFQNDYPSPNKLKGGDLQAASTAQADADSKRETSASAAASASTNASLASEAIKAQSTAWETTNASQTKLFADAKKSQSDLLARLK